MRKKTLKLFSAMLSATTLVSSLPMVSASAVEVKNDSSMALNQPVW